MRIEKLDLTAELAAKADRLEKELDRLKTPAGNLIPPAEATPDSQFLMVSSAEIETAGRIDFEAAATRRRLQRQVAANKPGAKQALADFEKQCRQQRPLSLKELLEALQKARRELKEAMKSGDTARIETANRRLRMIHAERERRGSIRAPA